MRFLRLLSLFLFLAKASCLANNPCQANQCEEDGYFPEVSRQAIKSWNLSACPPGRVLPQLLPLRPWHRRADPVHGRPLLQPRHPRLRLDDQQPRLCGQAPLRHLRQQDESLLWRGAAGARRRHGWLEVKSEQNDEVMSLRMTLSMKENFEANNSCRNSSLGNRVRGSWRPRRNSCLHRRWLGDQL